MLTLPRAVRVWLAVEPVHMGKGHDGLFAIVKSQFGDDPFNGNLFVFLGRRRDRAKILWWEPGGFVVYYKRLERGRMRLPAVPTRAVRVELSGAQLAMLLDGLDLSRIARPNHWQPRRTRGIDAAAAM